MLNAQNTYFENHSDVVDIRSKMISSTVPSSNESIDAIIEKSLHMIRTHLDMEIGFIARFADNKRIFEYIDSDDVNCPINVGDSDPLNESYCYLIAEGKLEEVIPDVQQNELAKSLTVTDKLHIGSYIGAPIALSNGDLYGSFCCFSTEQDASLRERDASTLKMFAHFISEQIEPIVLKKEKHESIINRIESVIANEEFSIVYQPVFHTVQNTFIGFESLTRFSAEPVRTPDIWFNEATEYGVGEQLEIAVIKKALLLLEKIPDDRYLTLNISPENVVNGAISKVLERVDLNRIVLEITEHASIPDYYALNRLLTPLRNRGMRVAVDDAGAGYASFLHILQLNPDIIKLDISITRDIHIDTARRSLAAALIAFASETGSAIIAEGVEKEEELSVLKQLGVKKVQGYLTGKPMPENDAIALFSKLTA